MHASAYNFSFALMMQPDWNLVLRLVLYAFYTVAGIQIFYYLFFFSRLLFFSNKKSINSHPKPVSVIICAKNELINLEKNLPAILEQKYSTFEVLVVNDNSEDGTADFLNKLRSKYPHLREVSIFMESRTIQGKRLALSLGLKAAQYEWCVLTDADCAPGSDNWLLNMERNFQETKEIVLGYAPCIKTRGFLNKCIRFETFFTAFQYLSFALSGFPYMGVGRNMAYRKKLFFENKGYISQGKVLSGDDDLFINKVARHKTTSLEIDPATFMYSAAKETWADWMWQKRRHISSGKYYRSIHKVLLGTHTLTHFLFYALMAILFVFKYQWQMVGVLFGARFLLQFIEYSVAMFKLREKDLIWMIPVFDVLLLIYYILLLPSLLINRKQKWK